MVILNRKYILIFFGVIFSGLPCLLPQSNLPTTPKELDYWESSIVKWLKVKPMSGGSSGFCGNLEFESAQGHQVVIDKISNSSRYDLENHFERVRVEKTYIEGRDWKQTVFRYVCINHEKVEYVFFLKVNSSLKGDNAKSIEWYSTGSIEELK